MGLEVETTGLWFRAQDGARVVMQRRQAMRRLLVKLVERRLGAPGSSVSVAELLDAGWPGERMKPSSALNRFYNAIAVLRGLGLRDLLIKTSSGYAIDPVLTVGWGAT